MPSYSTAKTQAERAKAYRQRKLEEGIKVRGGKRGKRGKPLSKWDKGEFIAIDGEGASIGEYETFEVESTGRVYKAKEHIYTLLAATSGESLYNGGKRLDSFSCINFLLDLSDSHKKAIFIIFAGGYDINHILMYGFERDILQKISRGETTEFEHEGVTYSIEYRARKSLTLRRGLEFYTDTKNRSKARWKSRIVIWDVFGFFQENYVGVMGKWLGKDHPHFELIKRMKALRGDFARVKQSEINAYNAAELETLAQIMVKVRDAVGGLQLKCTRWDGAGAIAAAIMQKHEIRNYKQITDDSIMEAVRTAYAGGRIEVCKIGNHKGEVYDYDINSAYPDVMRNLPCLLHGHWIRGEGEPPEGFTIVHCRFDFADNLPFYPLFYRTERMQISFPAQGEGWYWFPEYRAALECPGKLEVLAWVHWNPDCDHKPFSWINEYYETRRQWLKHTTADWQKGGEKIIKLGLNSLYGKTAQQLGGTEDKPPAYHQLEWAGYITSATRARLYLAGILQPSSIIGFATDGIFSTAPLPLPINREKQIGAWELKEPLPDGMTIAMAGVYWWHMKGGEFNHFSRGFDKDAMKTPYRVLDAWSKGLDEIEIPMHRLIGMGSACQSDTLWKMRGRFTEGMRNLKIDGTSHKRKRIDVKKTKPFKKLVDLEPSINIEYISQAQGCSHPYPIRWASDMDEYGNELEMLKEFMDSENV